jgi:NADP-dependent 3-hydroxy acid dehydrogenase YdfG
MQNSKTIVITGASRGIGRAIVEKYAQNGWQVVFCSKNPDSVAKTMQELTQKYPQTLIDGQVCDMSQKEAVLGFATYCMQTYGNIEILVNNAGIYIPGQISASNYDDDLEELMKINLYSAYWMGKILIPHFEQNKQGYIVNISSIAGIQAYPNGGSYAVSKFALTGYTKTIREELKTKNIKVIGIYPGATYTDSWSNSDLPKERFVAAEDIADIIFQATSLSNSAVVEDIIIRPQLGDI